MNTAVSNRKVTSSNREIYTHADSIEKLTWIKLYCSQNNYARFNKRLNELSELASRFSRSISGQRLTRDADAMSMFITTHEILILHKLFKFINESSIPIPRKIISLLLSEDGDPRINRAETNGRDHQFELELAIILNTYGNQITGFEDVECKSETGMHYSIQCKRPKSKKTIEKNIRKAGNQLLTKAQLNGGGKGVVGICLDLVEKSSMYFHDTPSHNAMISLRNERVVDLQDKFDSVFAIPKYKDISGGLAILNYLIWNNETGTLEPQIDIYSLKNPRNPLSTFEMDNLLPGFRTGRFLA